MFIILQIFFAQSRARDLLICQKHLCTSQLKPPPPDPRDWAGNLTFMQCYFLPYSPVSGDSFIVKTPGTIVLGCLPWPQSFFADLCYKHNSDFGLL